MWHLVTYSNCLKIVSTVALYPCKPDSFEVCLKLYNTESLHYKLYKVKYLYCLVFRY